ncbi:MAG: sulfurtransferase TusA family protein [Acidobacteriota bacterium]
MVNKKIVENDILDAFGFFCPIPLIKTKERIDRMKEGEILKVISDDEVILEDMTNWCKASGNEFIGYERRTDGLHLYVRKRGVSK